MDIKARANRIQADKDDWQAKTEKDHKTEVVQTKQIIDAIIEQTDFTRADIGSNGYVFWISAGGFYLSLCNQTERIVGDWHKKPTTEEERIVFGNDEHGHQTPEFREHFQYKDIIIMSPHVTNVKDK